MADVFLLFAGLVVVVTGAVLVAFQWRAASRRRQRALARHEQWLTSDEYISRVNAAKTAEDLRRAQEGQ